MRLVCCIFDVHTVRSEVHSSLRMQTHDEHLMHLLLWKFLRLFIFLLKMELSYSNHSKKIVFTVKHEWVVDLKIK